MSFLSFLWTPRHVASEEGILHPLPLSLPSLAWQKTFKALHGAKAGVLHLSLSSRPPGLSLHTQTGGLAAEAMVRMMLREQDLGQFR